jgi:hypothetical protein
MTTTTGVQLSSSDLRALAEASDSVRDVDSCVVANPEGDTPAYIVVTCDYAKEHRLKQIIELRTDDDPQLPRPREQLSLKTERKLVFRQNRARDINDCDAIFTSLSAVEKFVAPYYARVLGLEKAEEMRVRFAKDWRLVAMVHLPTSVEDEAALSPTAHVMAAYASSTDSTKLELLSMEDLPALE